MPGFEDINLFDDKKFSDILRDIYNNRTEKDEQIKILIADLRTLIKKPQDAAILVPLLKEYLEVGVKNDEHLVKMAAIVQRSMSRTLGGLGDDMSLSQDDLKELYAEYNASLEEKKKPLGTTDVK